MRLAAGVVVLACVATAGWGLGRVGGQGSPPPAEKPSGDAKPSVEAARRAIRESYEARIRSAWECLPKDATHLDRLNALRPLWEEERQWYEFMNTCAMAEILRTRHRNLDDRQNEFFVQFIVHDADFADGVKRPQSIDDRHVERVRNGLLNVHLLRRERTRNFLVQVLEAKRLTNEPLDTIWPDSP
jgi:hypothetical protein